MKRFSPTYAALLDLLFKTKVVNGYVYSNQLESNSYKRTKLEGQTSRVQQEITITDTELFEKCTPAQWYLVGLICSQLRQYNLFWKCPDNIKKSGTNRIAIKGLLEIKVLIKTETPHIYIVNPLHIRRGDFAGVMMTSLNLISDSPKVTEEHITNKKPVKEYILPTEFQLNNSTTNQYGFAEIPS